MKKDENVIDIIIDLQERGFDHDFILEHENIRCLQYDIQVSPDDFEILEIHRCKGLEHLRNDAFIHGIELKNYNIKGILMSNNKSFTSGLSVHLWKKFQNGMQKIFFDTKPISQHLKV